MTDIVERLRKPDDGLRWNDGDNLLAEAANEIERLRLDAVRYRWIKQQADDRPFFFHGTGWVSVGNLDAAIDAAMKG